MKPRQNRLRQLLNENKPTTATRVTSTWSFITEVVGSSGMFDYVEFLAEYAPFTPLDLDGICLAAERHNMSSIIKVAFPNRCTVLQTAIGSGFEGVLLADHLTADHVRETLTFLRAPQPGFREGKFGFPCRRFSYGGQGQISTLAFPETLKQTVVMLMIEKREAVENLEDILSVPGIDMVQWGPTDYSTSMGWDSAEKRDELKKIELHVIKTAQKKGVRPRCEINYANEADYYLKLGVKDFCMGEEIWNNIRYYQKEGGALKKLVQG